MKIKRFIGSDSRSAMRQVKETLGPDAMILSNRSVPEGVEILAAEDFGDELVSNGEIDLAAVVAQSGRDEKSSVNLHSSQNAGQPSVNQKKSDWLKSVALHTSPVAQPEPSHSTVADATIPELQRYPQQKKPAQAKKSGSFSDALKQANPTTAPQQSSAPQSSEQMNSMREELMQLRGMMESQLSSMNVGLWSQNSPTRAAVHKRLIEIGITESIATKLVTALNTKEVANPQQAIRSALATLARNVRIGEQTIQDKGGVVVLLGPAGAGKTTTIAKMALQFSQDHSARDVVLISTDNSRVGAHEQLSGFGKLLGVPVLRAINPGQIQEMIRAMQDKALVLVDTGSLTQMDLRDPRRIPTLQMDLNIDHYLVMPATTQFHTLHRIIRSLPTGSLKSGIISKVDEASNLGEILSAAISNRFPLSYWTEKQTITSKLQKTTQRELVEQAVTILKNRNLGNSANSFGTSMDLSSTNSLQIQ